MRFGIQEDYILEQDIGLLTREYVSVGFIPTFMRMPLAEARMQYFICNSIVQLAKPVGAYNKCIDCSFAEDRQNFYQ